MNQIRDEFFMKSIFSLCVGAILIAGFSPVLISQEKVEDPLPPHFPMLWEVKSGNGESKGFLFGTIHLADPRVVNFPHTVTDAIKSCDVVVTEIKMDAQSMNKAALLGLLPANEKRNLVDLIPKQSAKHLDAELKLISPMFGVKSPPFSRMKVWTVMVTLPHLEIMMEYSGMPSVDEKVVKIAEDAGIEQDALETMDEQMAALTSYKDEEMIELLDLTMEGMRVAREKELGSVSEMMILSYRRGDLDQLVESTVWSEELYGRPEPEVLKNFMHALIDERNLRMTERMMARYKASPGKKFFVAVGALHMPGKTGLIEQLKLAGFSVERVPAPKAVEAATIK